MRWTNARRWSSAVARSPLLNWLELVRRERHARPAVKRPRSSSKALEGDRCQRVELTDWSRNPNRHRVSVASVDDNDDGNVEQDLAASIGSRCSVRCGRCFDRSTEEESKGAAIYGDGLHAGLLLISGGEVAATQDRERRPAFVNQPERQPRDGTPRCRWPQHEPLQRCAP